MNEDDGAESSQDESGRRNTFHGAPASRMSLMTPSAAAGQLAIGSGQRASVHVPKYNLQGEVESPDAKKKVIQDLSEFSQGSIGRKERLRNALTGRSDGSGDGTDQPKELPHKELQDFLHQYDKSDPFVYKVVKLKAARSFGNLLKNLEDRQEGEGT